MIPNIKDSVPVHTSEYLLHINLAKNSRSSGKITIQTTTWLYKMIISLGGILSSNAFQKYKQSQAVPQAHFIRCEKGYMLMI